MTIDEEVEIKRNELKASIDSTYPPGKLRDTYYMRCGFYSYSDDEATYRKEIASTVEAKVSMTYDLREDVAKWVADAFYDSTKHLDCQTVYALHFEVFKYALGMGWEPLIVWIRDELPSLKL